MMNVSATNIDTREFLARVENDEGLALELLSIFRTDAAEQREALRRAVQAQSAEEVRRIAHAFKGSLSNLAANAASELASQLEQLAKAGKTGQFDAVWAEFHAALNAVLHDVEQLLASTSR